jgi:nicotinamidase/pyrazinamidase
VCGLALDYCVAATVRDALRLGIETEVVVDGTRSVNLQAGDDIRTLRELGDMGAVLSDSKILLPQAVYPEVRKEVLLTP